MLIPFAAGGGSDLAGRATAAAMEAANEDLNINVENIDGGSGAVGYAQLQGEAGNGQYLLATETALLALPLSGVVDWTYEDFTPIMKVADDFTLMVTRADAPYETCADVVEAAKSDRIVAGISGATGLDNVVFTLTEQQTDVEFDRVSFESGGELTAALLGEQIDIASLNPGEVIGQLESGDIKALCAYSDERYEYEELKDIPTASEQGIDVSFAQFRGVLAPGDISDSAKDYWVEQMEAAVETDEYDTYIEDNFLQPNTAAGDDFSAYLEENNAALQEVMGE
ncbi:twin-arginine translocation pathway signal protein [Nocardioides sp. S5]|nr:twin-arginine translocation pathway signal protein [Nocardioides sp. S5]